MNFNLLLIYLSVCATIGAFRPKRDRFLKFHGHQNSENNDSINRQVTNGQRGMLERNKQLMRLIANTKVSFAIQRLEVINYAVSDSLSPICW